MKKVRVKRIGTDGNKTYSSIIDAAKDVGGQASHISECMRGIDGRKRHKGYRWEGSIV